VSEPGKAIFLSYSSHDESAAERIRDALTAHGLEVWFDRNELRGGDAWDASIRKQIKECALFVPIVSADTDARREGYFRLEWKLAVDRSHLLADGEAFLLPVAIDGVSEATARVPDRFREFQWSRVEDAAAMEAFARRVALLLVDDAEPTLIRPSAVPAPKAREPIPSVPRSAAKRIRSWKIPAACAALLVAVLALFAGYKNAFPWQQARNAPGTDTRMTFAILPLSYPDGDKQAAAFAISLAEALVTRQTNSPWSRAVSRESAEAAVKKYPSLRDVGRSLNVRYLVRGHVTRNGDKFVTSLSVVDADSEQVLRTQELAWPVARPVNVFRAELDDSIGTLAGAGYARELQQVKLKNPEELDARELAYLARNKWNNTIEGYEEATRLLNKALAMAPDDPLALTLVFRMNLCDCRRKWSKNPEVQERIGVEALEKYLAKYPGDLRAQLWKVYVHELHERHEDAIVILDRLLEKSPDDPELLQRKAYELMRMGKDKDALALMQAAMREDSSRVDRARASAIQFKLSNYNDSADLAQKAIAEMDKEERADPWSGYVLLLRVAATAELGRMPQAKIAMADFNAAVPNARTISQIKEWMDPRAEIVGYQPFYVALRKAGIPE